MIYVVGSINLDYVAKLETLPKPGETVLGYEFTKRPGGKGANQAVSARRAGAQVSLIGHIGQDEDGAEALSVLIQDGVDISAVERIPSMTGIAIIQVDAIGENAIAVLPGANNYLSADYVRNNLIELTSQDVVLLQQEVSQEATAAAIACAKRVGATILLNLAPVLPTSHSIAEQVDVIIANETEFTQLTGHPASTSAAEAWCQKTGKMLALTLGAGGAIFVGQGKTIRSLPPLIEPVDTVGAGDTFCGYLAAGISSGASLDQTMALSVEASSACCLAEGSQNAMPWLKSGTLCANNEL